MPVISHFNSTSSSYPKFDISVSEKIKQVTLLSKYHLRNIITEGIFKLAGPDRTVEYVLQKNTQPYTIGCKIISSKANEIFEVTFSFQ